MKLILNSLDERHRMEVYNEYLLKIPELLKQLETVEKMYDKAVLEVEMMKDKDENYSAELYNDRLNRIKQQCEEREADIIEQLKLIFSLKGQIEAESSALGFLMEK